MPEAAPVEPAPAAPQSASTAPPESASTVRAKTAQGSDAFGGLPEPVELDDEPDPYFPVPEPQPFGGVAADGRGSEDPAGVLAQLLDGDGRGAKKAASASGAAPSESDEVPFYEQRMPVPQRPRGAGASPRGAASISERIMAAHGQERQKPRAESAAVDDGESDVSLSDPTISQSKLVGLDVVLSTFDGTIIEEIARTDGGN